MWGGGGGKGYDGEEGCRWLKLKGRSGLVEKKEEKKKKMRKRCRMDRAERLTLMKMCKVERKKNEKSGWFYIKRMNEIKRKKGWVNEECEQ
jgi:hypothetical protein